MNILAVETSQQATSVAVSLENKIQERYVSAPRRHGAVLSMIDAVLQECSVTLLDMDALAFSCGPGSFTGLRLGAGVVQGLAFAAQRPVVLVSSLQALAQAIWEEQGAEQVLVGWDARMDQVYWGQYALEEGWMLPVVPDVLLRPEECTIATLGERASTMGGGGEQKVCASTESRGRYVPMGSELLTKQTPVSSSPVGVGNAWQVYGNRLPAICTSVWEDQCPRARYVAQCGQHNAALGKAISAEQALPVYLSPWRSR